MIIKSFEIRKKKFDKQNFFLVYGENEGLKREIIETLREGFNGEKETIDETNVLKNTELFYEKLFNQSLFGSEKIIIIKRCSDKILKF